METKPGLLDCGVVGEQGGSGGGAGGPAPTPPSRGVNAAQQPGASTRDLASGSLPRGRRHSCCRFCLRTRIPSNTKGSVLWQDFLSFRFFVVFFFFSSCALHSLARVLMLHSEKQLYTHLSSCY